VPLLIISPFAKRGYISHTQYEQSSILKFIEQRFHLPALTARDGSARDMLDSFDFDQPAQPPLILAPRQCPAEPAGMIMPKAYTAFDND
jgi:phospholipase C